MKPETPIFNGKHQGETIVIGLELMNLQVHCDLIKGVATCTVTRPSEHPINSWGPDSSIWLVFQLIYFLSYIPERMIPIDFFGSNQKMSRVQNRWLIKQSYTCNKQYWLGIIVIQCNSIGKCPFTNQWDAGRNPKMG